MGTGGKMLQDSPRIQRRWYRVRQRAIFALLATCAVLVGLWAALGTQEARRLTELAAAVGDGGGQAATKGSGDRADCRTDPGGQTPESVTNSVGMKLVLVPAGEFMMGNSLTAAEEIAQFKRYGADLNADGFKIEYPRHRVRISRPFYMGAYHVTRGQFRRFVEDTGYKTDAERGEDPGANGLDPEKGTFFGFHEKRSWRNVAFEQADSHPVVNVSWNDAVAFCEWLSRKERRTYRLPTEAEWEYACRAGTTTRYWCGNDPEKLGEVANTADAALKAKFGGTAPTIRARDGYVFTSPVGSFRANPFGLYDMHGNVWQWCAGLDEPAVLRTVPRG